MKFLYYTLYRFYTKIIKLHKQYAPIINITAVIAILIIFLLLAIANTYYYSIGNKFPPYSFLVPSVGYLILWKILYEYYKPRESNILKEMSKKPLWQRNAIIITSTAAIGFIVYLWMFDGMFNLYNYLIMDCSL